MEKIIIRKVRKQDIESINCLNIEMHKFLGRLVGVKFSADELKDEKVSEEELKGMIVAEDKKTNQIVGYISFSTEPEKDEWYGKHLYLFEIVVTKKYRGKGIGEKLIKKFMSMAKSKKLNIKVDTLVKNKATIKFYKKFGFKPFMIYFIKEHGKRLKL